MSIHARCSCRAQRLDGENARDSRPSARTPAQAAILASVTRDPDLLVLGTINASLPRPIDGPTLARCLREAEAASRWRPHLDAFFAEVPLEAVARFIAHHRLPHARVLATARRLGIGNPALEDWLAEMAGLAAPRA